MTFRLRLLLVSIFFIGEGWLEDLKLVEYVQMTNMVIVIKDNVSGLSILLGKMRCSVVFEGSYQRTIKNLLNHS